MTSVGFSLDDYDSIGFDLDCTIAEYNVKNLCKLVYNLLAKYLVEEKNYAKEILVEPSEESECFLQKGLFMDLKKGNVLKINGEGVIVMATHGTRVLTDKEIVLRYGPDKTLGVFKDIIRDPLSIINTPSEKLVRSVLDCFDMSCILLFARVVDHLDERNGGALDVYNIWPDILSGLFRLYSRTHFASGESEFFSELRNNPEIYYKKCSPEKLKWLKEVKAKKFVFLLTGSYIDFASLTASYCLGEDWKDYFDVIICYARKPFFFRPGHPYLRVEENKERDVVQGKDLEVNTVYSQGNWRELRAFISRRTKVEEPKCLYIGDNLIQDVYSPDHFNCCDSVAVSLELTDEFRFSKLWGSFFEAGEGETSYWNRLIKTHAKICVSDLDVFARRGLNFQYNLLNHEKITEINQQNGYYRD